MQALGVPTLESWPGLADLPNKILFKPVPAQPLEHIFPEVGDQPMHRVCMEVRQEGTRVHACNSAHLLGLLPA